MTVLKRVKKISTRKMKTFNLFITKTYFNLITYFMSVLISSDISQQVSHKIDRIISFAAGDYGFNVGKILSSNENINGSKYHFNKTL
jgi:hypothetical protein